MWIAGKKGEGDISKKQFLEMLKNSTKKGMGTSSAPPPTTGQEGSTWAAVDEDYLMGSGKMQVSPFVSISLSLCVGLVMVMPLVL